MDEPFGALDSLTRSIMQDFVLEIWEEQRKTVVLVTHDIDEAIYLADKTVVMTAHPGRIREVIAVAKGTALRDAKPGGVHQTKGPRCRYRSNRGHQGHPCLGDQLKREVQT
jgi:ABC-type nitrate/sulfonate/bicarbonate transport system ATPase subunit